MKGIACVVGMRINVMKKTNNKVVDCKREAIAGEIRNKVAHFRVASGF